MKEREGYLWTAGVGAALMPLAPLYVLVGYIVLKEGVGSVRLELYVLPLAVLIPLLPGRLLATLLTYIVPKFYGKQPITQIAHVVWGSIIFAILDSAWVLFLWGAMIPGPPERWAPLLTMFLAPPSAAWVAWQSRRSREEGLPFWPQYSLGGLVLIVLYLGGVMAVVFGKIL